MEKSLWISPDNFKTERAKTDSDYVSVTSVKVKAFSFTLTDVASTGTRWLWVLTLNPSETPLKGRYIAQILVTTDLTKKVYKRTISL